MDVIYDEGTMPCKGETKTNPVGGSLETRELELFIEVENNGEPRLNVNSSGLVEVTKPIGTSPKSLSLLDENQGPP